MAPEQYAGSDVDARADQYSFCVALGAAVFGREPATADDKAPRKGPRALRAVIERGMAPDPAARFASMDELREALRRATSRVRAVAFGASLVGLAAASAAVTLAIASPGDRTARAIAPSEPAATATATSGSADAMPAPTPPDALAPHTATPTGDPAAPTPTAADGVARVVRATAPQSTATTGARPAEPPPATRRDRAPELDAGSAAGPRATGTAPSNHAPPPGDRSTLIRDLVRPLGYGGLTYTSDDNARELRELRAKLADETNAIARGVLLYAIAATERRRGSCAAAERVAREAVEVFAAATDGEPRPTGRDLLQATVFHGRAEIVRGLCELTSGRYRDAGKRLSRAVSSVQDASEEEATDAWFAGAIGYIEGGIEGGVWNLRGMPRNGSRAQVQRIEAYERAIGVRE